MRDPVFHILTNACYCLFNFRHPSEYKVVSQCGLDLYFSNDWWYSTSFFCAYWVFISSLEKFLYTYFAYFQLFVFLLLSYREFFIYSWQEFLLTDILFTDIDLIYTRWCEVGSSFILLHMGSSCPGITCWRHCPFLTEWFWKLCQKSIYHIWVSLFLRFLI